MIDWQILVNKNPAFTDCNVKVEDFLLENDAVLRTKTGIIYIIVNLVNGKVYVGQTIQSFAKRYKNRWWHYTDSDHLKKSVTKYGRENFGILMIEDGRGQNILDILETYYILTFQSHREEFGYNKTTGGQKYRFSEEVKLKMSENHPFKLTNEEFIQRSKEIHKNKYSYNKVEYKNSQIKVAIFCNTCQKEFYQIPATHLQGGGCSDCGDKSTVLHSRLSKEEYLKRFTDKFGDEFIINLDNYKFLNEGTISVTHKNCGSVSLWKPVLLLISKVGCRHCGLINRRRSIVERRKNEDKELLRSEKLEKGYKQYIEKCRNIHGDKFEYKEPSWKTTKNGFTLLVKQKCNICNHEFLRQGTLWNRACPRCTQLELGGKHNSKIVNRKE